MNMIDTHTHIYLNEFENDRDEVVERAVSNNVIKMLMPNIDVDSFSSMISVADRYPGICYPMSGLHPGSVKSDYISHLRNLEDLVPNHKVIAIGEIGIDLYRNREYRDEQIEAFRHQVAFAIEQQLPVVVHSRESFPEVFSVLREFKGEGLKGVLHAFSGGIEEAHEAVALGFKLGIGGMVTFRNSGLPDILKELRPEHLILETDSPYLAPAPYRGKRNESSYIVFINRKIASIYGMKEEESAQVTYENSVNLFNL
jgi:TatD DNase family protein